ncbi:MAG TPA: hypothetical protein VMW28_00760, partial [Pelolinea sp.]|nr:hypothetical protein [Pelolinea sp.]
WFMRSTAIGTNIFWLIMSTRIIIMMDIMNMPTAMVCQTPIHISIRTNMALSNTTIIICRIPITAILIKKMPE